MTLSIIQNRFTPDDLLNLEEEGLFELVDGKLVEKEMGSLATETATIVIARLFNFVAKSGIGRIYTEQTYQCFPEDPDLIRRPDIAFISTARLGGVPDEGHVQIAPDLAIEVVSPNDKIYELDRKLMDYRTAGIQRVWVINPQSRIMRIYRLDHTFAELGEADTLTGDPLLPGFSILVSDLLPKR